MTSVYRRLGLLARLAHTAYGFLNAHALATCPQLGALMALVFLLYEFTELLHDVLAYGRPQKADWPDEELAEYGAGLALYALLSLAAPLAAG